MGVFCPVTTRSKGYPFEVQIPEDIKVSGVVLSDHVKNLDWKARNAEYIDYLPADSLEEVLGKLKALLF